MKIRKEKKRWKKWMKRVKEEFSPHLKFRELTPEEREYIKAGKGVRITIYP